MRFKKADLIGAIFLAAITVGWVQLPNPPLLFGIILGLPLVFVLPGYTLTQALFRRQQPEPTNNLILLPRLKTGQPVSAIDYIILSLGLSLSIDVIVGFMLNIFPFGLQRQSWTISLGIITTVFALIAAYRRRKDSITFGKLSKLHITFRQYILFGLALLIAAAAIWFSVVRPPATQADFTQFWMLPSTHANKSCVVIIGVQSYESASVTYRITVKANGTQVNSWASVVLEPQEKWEQSISIKPESSASIYIEAQLYRADNPDNTYRDVHLTMHTVKGSNTGQIQQCTG
jgi:uncharacterized membrane protein